MNSSNVARSLIFFSNSLATSDFTVNDDEINHGKPIKQLYLLIIRKEHEYKHEFFYVVTIDDVNFERDVEDSDSSDVEDIGQEESEGEFQNFELGLNLQQL